MKNEEFLAIMNAERVIRTTRWLLVAAWAFLGCTLCLNVVQYTIWEDQQDHIEYLEEYIEDNQWPTPFWPPLPDIDIDIRRK